MSKNDGPLVFPTNHDAFLSGMARVWTNGMTMRQWYKGLVVGGLVASPGTRRQNNTSDPGPFAKTVTEIAAAVADAMIAEDEKHNS